jgi:16S rRNA (uracil1498-N3)-methyltransferase
MPSFYSPEFDDTKPKITLIMEEYHHLAHVLRHKAGDEVKINSGKGWLGKGSIESINKTQAVIAILEAAFHKQTTSYAIAFSLLRSKHDEWLVEKVTELGVKDLFPLSSRFSVRNPSHNTIARFHLTALNAIKQCDNPWLPKIHPILALEQAIDEIIQTGYTPIVASEKQPDVWLDNLERGKQYCFLIGPEGGFSPEEFFLFQKKGVTEVSVSGLILRAETAAIAIASQCVLLNRT